jgi:serine/threonine-protein kinase
MIWAIHWMPPRDSLMPEGCPPRTALNAFSSGSLAGCEMEELQIHVSACLHCASQLEEITRDQLMCLGAGRFAATAGSSPPAVKKLIELAQGGFYDSRPSAEAAVRAALDAPALAGTIGRFAGYDVIEIAGSGGMGVVLKARDSTLGRTVALKLLPPTRGWDEESAARFLHEARTIAAIEHDNVVVVHTAGREKGIPYLVMPFHAEGTLEQFLQHTSPMESADVVRVGTQLARALEVTHAKGVLHRDIKPSNVLLEDGLVRVRLADFGLAQPVRDNRADPKRMIAGTPHYMSPEQARGETIGARSDLFGLGALFFHLATGQTIYNGDSPQDILQAAAKGQPTPVRRVNPEVSAALATIVDKLLATKPEDRFTSATDVATALEQIAKAKSPLWHWLRRAALIGLAVFLALAAGIVTLDSSGRRHSSTHCFARSLATASLSAEDSEPMLSCQTR